MRTVSMAVSPESRAQRGHRLNSGESFQCDQAGNTVVWPTHRAQQCPGVTENKRVSGGRSEPSPLGEAYSASGPQNCWQAVGQRDPGESRSLRRRTLMQAKARFRMWDKAGSEPGAISGHRV